METDDELHSPGSLLTPSNVMTTTVAPNHFLLSTYKEDLHHNADNRHEDILSSLSINIHGNIKLNLSSSYKCCLCRKIVDDATLTCAKCVNTGHFCPSKHDTCSNKRRQTLARMLNSDDYEEYQQYALKHSINTPPHLQCSDRRFFLKKFNKEKQHLQTEYQTKMEPIIETHKVSEKILIQKKRLELANQLKARLEDKINQGKIMNRKTHERIDIKRARIQFIKNKIHDISMVLTLSRDEIRKKNDKRMQEENKLHLIRRQRLNEVYKYIFPIEHVSSIEEDLASRVRALSSAQLSIVDEETNDRSENDETLNSTVEKFKIVNSFLRANGDYQIPKLLSALDVDNKTTDVDSFQSTRTPELYEVLSALSHACQLINVIAVYLHIALPFRLHQWEFNGDNLTTDLLRADIAKLNANIVTSCLAQNIPIENAHVTHTMENLLKLLTYKEYSSRPKPVLYSQQYVDMIEEEINEISRAYVTEYWFDDVEKDVNDILNSDEWETISHDFNIPDDPSIHEHFSLSSSPSTVHPPSSMSGSIGYWKNVSSSFINSIFHNSGKS